MKKIIFIIVALILSSATSQAAIVFQDDFESGLDKWTKKSPSYANIVADPVSGYPDDALYFSAGNAGGDIFTTATFFKTGKYLLSFDYYGATTLGVNGGYVGISEGNPGTHDWLWATGVVSGASPVLKNTGTWNSYQFLFTSTFDFHLMLESYGAGGAYFDNIKLASVPIPGTILLLGSGLAGFIGIRRKTKSTI